MAVRLVDIAVAFQWDGAGWTDETTNLIAANGVLEMTPPGESFLSARQIIQQASVTLANRDLRYSIENTASAIYAYIQDGQLYQRKCRIQFKVDVGTFVTVFTGYIKLPVYDYLRNRVTFTVWDIGEILKEKFSTVMLQDYLEHEVVIYYLELAGLVDGVDFISPAYAAANSVTATIEASNTPVPFSWLDDEPVINEIVEIAQASGSRVYVDRDGLVHYERNNFWITTPAYTPEVIDLTNAGELNLAYDDKAFYDAITVEYTERSIGAGPEELWKLAKPKLILPGQTEEIIARYRYPGVSIAALVANDNYFITDLAGNDVSGSVTVILNPTYAQQATINVTNSTASTVMLSQMTIYGVAIHGLPSEQYTVDTGGSYGRRIDVRGNPYLQTRLQAQVAGDFLAWWYSTLKLIFPLNGLRGAVERDLGRQITVQWYDRLNDASYTYDAIIVRSAWRINIDAKTKAIDYSQDITALQNVFAGGAIYFIIGSSSLGGPDLLWY